MTKLATIIVQIEVTDEVDLDNVGAVARGNRCGREGGLTMQRPMISVDGGLVLHGFKLVETDDRKLGAYLRDHGALDNVSSMGRANLWRDAGGTLVAVAIFNSLAPTYGCWVPNNATM